MQAKRSLIASIVKLNQLLITPSKKTQLHV